MKIVESYGYLWRLTDAAHKHMLVELAAGREIDLNQIGKFIGVIDTVSVVSITPERAAEMLKELK